MRPHLSASLGSVLLAFGVVVVPTVLALHGCGGGPGDTGDGSADSPVLFGDGGSGDGGMLPFEDAGFTAPDCPGCTFPKKGAPPCASGTPPITVIYPNDGVLVPPNMNVISVHWTPFGAAFKEFEVDFDNGVTFVHVVTKCAAQTMDSRTRIAAATPSSSPCAARPI
jgi:hypothetical protein